MTRKMKERHITIHGGFVYEQKAKRKSNKKKKEETELNTHRYHIKAYYYMRSMCIRIVGEMICRKNWGKKEEEYYLLWPTTSALPL